jgi:hypothetical protein
MKIIPAALFLLLFTGLHAQQKNFLPVDKHLKAPVFPSTLAEIFESPEIHSSITIFADELMNVASYDFSKLEALELVQIKFTLCPDSSDAKRKIFIDSINTCMKNLAAFKKCPKLKKMVFCIGEQVYLTHAQTDVENAYEDKKRQELFDKNVEGAWKAFGQDVAKQLPNIKLYAFTWGW